MMGIKMKKYSITCLVICFLYMFPYQTYADNLVIITSVKNTKNLPLKDVARIYLGKATLIPDGDKFVPLNLSPSNPLYAEFSRKVLNKSVNQLRAYWAKRIFTGKGRPPKVIEAPQELKEIIAEDERYLGYLDREMADRTVRWVFVE